MERRLLSLKDCQSPSTTARRCFVCHKRLLLIALFAFCGTLGAKAYKNFYKEILSDGLIYFLYEDHYFCPGEKMARVGFPVDIEADYTQLTNVVIKGVINYNGKDYPVKETMPFAFSNYTNIKSIIIPASCTEIDDTSFKGCTGVTSLICYAPIDNMVPFADMQNLDSANITWSGDVVPAFFQFNKKIKDVTFRGHSYTKIVGGAFLGCTALTNASFRSASLQEIGMQAFEGCSNLTRCEFQSSLKIIRDRAFKDCSKLNDVPIDHTSLESIGNDAFSNCTAIGKVTFPATLTYIGDYAYYNSGITMADNFWNTKVTAISESAFRECTSLQSVSFPSTLKTIGNYAFCGDTKIQTALVVNVTSIGDYAYSRCKALSVVNLSPSLTHIGKYAFNSTNLNGSGIYGLEKTKLGDISEGLFYNCKSLQYINLPQNMQTIGASAFSLTNITSLDCPWGLREIGANAFENCTKLTSVNFKFRMESIGDEAFKGCSALKTVTSAKAISLGKDVFKSSLSKSQRDPILINYPEYDSYKNCGWDTYFNLIFPEATKISIDKTTATIQKIGGIITLTTTVLPAGANPNVTWETDNSNVAIVNNNGMVLGKSYGIATITATTVNGLKATCKVQVGQFDSFDINKDGIVNSTDVVALYNYILAGSSGGANEADFDLNGDGKVDVSDVVAIYNYMLNGK